MTGPTTGSGPDCCGAPHHDAIAHSGDPHNYHYVEGELVVERSALPAVEAQLRKAGIEFDACEVHGCQEVYLLLRLRATDQRVPELLEQLEGAGVTGVHPHHLLSRSPDYHAQWVPIAQPVPWNRPKERLGSPVGKRVAILDTGWYFDPHDATDATNAVTQRWFRDQLVVKSAHVTRRKPGDALFPEDGHGPFAASVVLQEAPNAVIYGYDVPTTGGFITDCQLAAAICEYQRELLEADVVNMSFGAFTHKNRPLPLTAQVIAGMFEDFYDHQEELPPTPQLPKPLVVASAGNNGSTAPQYPAALPYVLGVGALDGDEALPACWSARGPWVFTYAPGTNVMGSYLTGTYRFDEDAWSRPLGEPVQAAPGCILPGGPHQPQATFDGWAMWSGTSFAAPFVAGRLAALLEQGKTADEAVLALRGTVRSSGGS